MTKVIIKKYNESCIFCGSTRDLKNFDSKIFTTENRNLYIKICTSHELSKSSDIYSDVILKGINEIIKSTKEKIIYINNNGNYNSLIDKLKYIIRGVIGVYRDKEISVL